MEILASDLDRAHEELDPLYIALAAAKEEFLCTVRAVTLYWRDR